MRENAMTGIVFSNMHDECLCDLTAGRTFASVPFGSRYRLVDFTLSNMANCGIDRIGVITKHNYRSLMEHIGSGKAWDLNRKNGGIRIISPYGQVQHGVYHDRLEALYGARDFLTRQNARYVVLSDCNTVVNLNLSAMLRQHLKSDADITIAVKRLTLRREEACHTMAFEIDKVGRITGVHYHPRRGGEYETDLNIWILSRELLLKIMDEGQSRGYRSLGADVLRENLENLRVMSYRVPGFVRKIMSFEGYFEANMALLQAEHRHDLFHPDHPIYTKIFDTPPTLYAESARAVDSLVADGCDIRGRVERCIVFRNVTVEEGAAVQDCILLPDSRICAGARMRFSVADREVTVRSGHGLSGDSNYPIYLKKGRIL